MEFFDENNQRIKVINYFQKKAPSQIFRWVLYARLVRDCRSEVADIKGKLHEELLDFAFKILKNANEKWVKDEVFFII